VTPATGQVFLGWTLDGVYVGYASRRVVIAVLYQAFNAVYSVDRVP